MSFHKGHKHSAQLTPEQVHEMRGRYAEGWTQGALAREYKISVGHVGRIVRGEVWHGYDNPGKQVGQPMQVAQPPADIEAEALASEQRLAALMARHLPKQSTETALNQFINPLARQRYLGEQASGQSDQGETGQSPDETARRGDQKRAEGKESEAETQRKGSASTGETISKEGSVADTPVGGREDIKGNQGIDSEPKGNASE